MGVMFSHFRSRSAARPEACGESLPVAPAALGVVPMSKVVGNEFGAVRGIEFLKYFWCEGFFRRSTGANIAVDAEYGVEALDKVGEVVCC